MNKIDCLLEVKQIKCFSIIKIIYRTEVINLLPNFTSILKFHFKTYPLNINSKKELTKKEFVLKNSSKLNLDFF